MRAWGWIPNLSGNYLLASPCLEDVIKSNTRYESHKKGEYVGEKSISDIKDSKSCMISYVICDPDKVTVSIYDGQKILLDGEICIHDGRGLVEFNASSATKNEKILIKELYVELKDIFHKHTHHSEGATGPDLLIDVVFEETEEKAVKRISEQYVKKVSVYPKTIKALEKTLKKALGKENEDEKLKEIFYDTYIQASGDFLYGSCFVEMFSKELGDDYAVLKYTLNNGIEPTKVVFDCWSNARIVKLNEKIKDLNTETKKVSVDMANLTWYVLAMAIVTAIIGIASLCLAAYPWTAQYAYVAFVTIALAVMVMVITYKVTHQKESKTSP